MMVAGVISILVDRAMMMMAGTMAPMKALDTMPISPVVDVNVTPAMMAMTAPKQAPDDIPVLYGSARGFAIMDCMSAPQMASEAPAVMATITWGTDLFQM
jgi:hypothetical protein